jgi:hypothetical protein
MQGWKPDIAGTLGPKYLAIAEAIARDIEAGILNPGDRLRRWAWTSPPSPAPMARRSDWS